MSRKSDKGSDWKDFRYGSAAKYGFARCHENHPELTLGNGKVLGASCLSPRKGYDIYVGLDRGMARIKQPFPWEPSHASEKVEVFFPVTDGEAPKEVEQFKAMVAWLAEQLAAGRRVHIGCIGGHGRTGVLLAALVKVVHGDANAGEWVRKNYCKSAIETMAQVAFLEKHYSIAPVSASKAGYLGSWGAEGAVYGGEGNSHKVATFSAMPGKSMWHADIVIESL